MIGYKFAKKLKTKLSSLSIHMKPILTTLVMNLSFDHKVIMSDHKKKHNISSLKCFVYKTVESQVTNQE